MFLTCCPLQAQVCSKRGPARGPGINPCQDVNERRVKRNKTTCVGGRGHMQGRGAQRRVCREEQGPPVCLLPSRSHLLHTGGAQLSRAAPSSRRSSQPTHNLSLQAREWGREVCVVPTHRLSSLRRLPCPACRARRQPNAHAASTCLHARCSWQAGAARAHHSPRLVGANQHLAVLQEHVVGHLQGGQASKAELWVPGRNCAACCVAAPAPHLAAGLLAHCCRQPPEPSCTSADLQVVGGGALAHAARGVIVRAVAGAEPAGWLSSASQHSARRVRQHRCGRRAMGTHADAAVQCPGSAGKPKAPQGCRNTVCLRLCPPCIVVARVVQRHAAQVRAHAQHNQPLQGPGWHEGAHNAGSSGCTRTAGWRPASVTRNRTALCGIASCKAPLASPWHCTTARRQAAGGRLTLGSFARAESGCGSRSLLRSTSLAAAMSAAVLRAAGPRDDEGTR